MKVVLREHDAKSMKHYNGDIVRQIRISPLRGDITRRRKWFARLSNNMRSRLLRLEALPEQFVESPDQVCGQYCSRGLSPDFWIYTALRQPRRWCELFSLASENGYRRIRFMYRDRKEVDAKAIEDCVRRILPSKYYAIDSERMLRIVQLNRQLLSDVPYLERVTVASELTSDHDDCGSHISDRCGRPWEHSFQADEESLFLNHIYLNSYSTLPKRYLTSFAVKRDFFRAFFVSEEDDLDQHPPPGRPQEITVGIWRKTLTYPILKGSPRAIAFHPYWTY
ncbi:MAG: hypothetical protein Q9187_001422 [Circinaria calcarea]